MALLKELRIVKDHWYFRTIKRTRPWAIHTESLHKDNIWEATKRYVKNGNKAIWFVVAPVNYDFVKTESGINISKKDWEKRILERYKWLRKNNQEIQVHVHLRVKMELYESKKEEETDVRNKILDSVKWFRDNGFNVDKIVFGWWSYNKLAEDIAKEKGLKVIRRLNNYFIHDYDLTYMK